MSEGSSDWEAWKVELWVVFLPAALLLETGADLHMPWWAMVIALVLASAPAPKAFLALRHDAHAIGLSLLFGTGYWLAWQAACWLGENGAEWLHRGWRWWLVAVVVAAGFRAWDARHMV